MAGAQSGEVPLHWAANNGHKEVVAALLAAGANPGAKGHMGRTPIMYAKDDDTRALLIAQQKTAAEGTAAPAVETEEAAAVVAA